MHFQFAERFLHQVGSFVHSHGWYVLGGFVVGCLFVGFLLRYFRYQHYRWIQRLAVLAEERDLERFSVSSWFSAIRIRRKNATRRVPRGFALQGPAVRSKGILTETVRIEDGTLTYLFPENNPANPEGIQFSAEAVWIFGDPVTVRMPIAIVPATAPCVGSWYPAIVHKGTGLTHPRSDCPKRNFWQHNFRNLFIGDFVAQGDPIGVIHVPGRFRTSTKVVLSPVSGFVLQFGVQSFTPVAAQAILMLLGIPQDLREVSYQGDYSGRFEQPEGGLTNLVGQVIEAGTLLGTVTALGRTFQEPIAAPVRMRIVRQHTTYGSTVQYSQPLFTYIAV